MICEITARLRQDSPGLHESIHPLLQDEDICKTREILWDFVEMLGLNYIDFKGVFQHQPIYINWNTRRKVTHIVDGSSVAQIIKHKYQLIHTLSYTSRQRVPWYRLSWLSELARTSFSIPSESISFITMLDGMFCTVCKKHGLGDPMILALSLHGLSVICPFWPDWITMKDS